MGVVTLQFATVQELWKFRIEVRANILDINIKDITLRCKCSDEHIELAVKKYKAVVITSDSEKDTV